LQGLKNITGNKIDITYNEGYKIEKGAIADQTLIQLAADAASKADIATSKDMKLTGVVKP
jgi:beta-glucosidase